MESLSMNQFSASVYCVGPQGNSAPRHHCVVDSQGLTNQVPQSTLINDPLNARAHARAHARDRYIGAVACAAGQSGTAVPDRLYQFREEPTPRASDQRFNDLSEDQQIEWLERMAICTIDGRLDNEQAEMIAWRQVTPTKTTTLHLCQCRDCMNWSRSEDRCRELPIRKYTTPESLHPALRQYWTDIGMIKIDEWHYCSKYDGPESSDQWRCRS